MDRKKSWEILDTDNINLNLANQDIAISKGYRGSAIIIASLKGKGIFRFDNAREQLTEI